MILSKNTRLRPRSLDEMTQMCRRLKKRLFWLTLLYWVFLFLMIAISIVSGCASPPPLPTLSALGVDDFPQPIEPKSFPLVPSDDEDARYFNAIRIVESGEDDWAVGDGGKSRGPYQIGRAYWKDGCEYGGVLGHPEWDYDLFVWSRPKVEQVMKWYWRRYKAFTWEQKARMHNGGPKGMEKQATVVYWERVRNIAESMRKDGV